MSPAPRPADRPSIDIPAPRELDGRTAVITGAGSGIGRAVAELFAAAGSRVVLVGRNRSNLDEVRDALESVGTACAVVSGDVAVPDTADSVRDAAVTAFGGIDVLVNNAGTALMKAVPETTVSEWHRVIDTNLTSAFLLSRMAIPLMRERGGGAIVNVASEAGVVGFRTYAAYSASKAGLVNLTRAMALDHAAERIRVNCVCPGSIETPLLEEYYASFPDPAEARREDEAAHPLGIAAPIDVAEAILFLASERSRYVTCHALVVDGGFTAG